MGGNRPDCRMAACILASLAALPFGGGYADELRCHGPFARDTDHDRLVAAFGRENVVRETVYAAEGVRFEASVVYPKDRPRRLEVLWWDEKARRRPASIHFTGSGWTGPAGVRIRMSLSEVEAANRKPFVLYGFGWDYGGWTSDWKEGALAALPGGCRLKMKFKPADDPDEAAWLKATGDHEFGSSSPEIGAVTPQVEEISLRYPKMPDARGQ